MNALTHTDSGRHLRRGHLPDVVRKRAGCVYESTGGYAECGFGLAILHQGSNDLAAGISFKAANGGIVQNAGPRRGGALYQRQVVTGVVELAIAVEHRTEQATGPEPGHADPRPSSSHKTAAPQACFAGKPIVGFEAEFVIDGLNDAETRDSEAHASGKMRRIAQHDGAFAKSGAHYFVLRNIQFRDGLLQIAKPAVDEFGGSGRGCAPEVAGIEHERFKPPQLCIQRTARAGCSCSD